jgi:hypothetical protein
MEVKDGGGCIAAQAGMVAGIVVNGPPLSTGDGGSGESVLRTSCRSAFPG